MMSKDMMAIEHVDSMKASAKKEKKSDPLLAFSSKLLGNRKKKERCSAAFALY